MIKIVFLAITLSAIIVFRLVDITFAILNTILQTKGVWLSSRRLILLAMLNYVEVIVSFAVLYKIADIKLIDAFSTPLSKRKDTII